MYLTVILLIIINEYCNLFLMLQGVRWLFNLILIAYQICDNDQYLHRADTKVVIFWSSNFKLWSLDYAKLSRKYWLLFFVLNYLFWGNFIA